MNTIILQVNHISCKCGNKCDFVVEEYDTFRHRNYYCKICLPKTAEIYYQNRKEITNENRNKKVICSQCNTVIKRGEPFFGDSVSPICNECNYINKNKVIIEIKDGVAEIIQNPNLYDVEIRDYDINHNDLEMERLARHNNARRDSNGKWYYLIT